MMLYFKWRRTGHASQTLVVYPPIRAHGHREGDEHPLRSNLGTWHTLPYYI